MYAIYPSVVMEPSRSGPDGSTLAYRLRPAPATSPASGSAPAAGAAGPAPPASIAAVFELCDGGSLGSALTARTFPWPDPRAGGNRAVVDMRAVYLVLLDVALALRHLHANGLVHRDLKPANLLLRSSPRDPRGFTVKLADFGFVMRLSEAAEDGTRYGVADQACGTVTHMAPEALVAKAKISAAADVYSFGILMWELFAGGVRPYPHLRPDKIPANVYRGARPAFGEGVPLMYRSLAASCWAADPRRRPKASDLVNTVNAQLQALEA
ncbi:hypothetical protein GPECTOR_74g674 [Gonium pectorale]|uniref:Protein kinase domain-containing protein n=1 Tax=Gonium pectorale TaxID=33097 RepID=A0A150G436_GONPE|nr:hypothetical protein GPECTOR_74g674 [Gonium pectorale]|eukprot:KXZ44060.1 hypothetical protein GPECTOR_74g674 [Gonium pectorale]